MKTVFIFLFCFGALILKAQNSLFPVYDEVNFGYIDTEGNMVIPFKYKNAGLFSDGLACVREQGRFGYIDETGTYILPPIYDYAANFEKGYAKVWIKGMCRLINKKGEALFVGEYIDFNWNRENDTIEVKTITKCTGTVDRKGNILQDTIAEQIADYYESDSPKNTEYFGAKYQLAKKNNKTGIITKDRKLVIQPRYRWITFVTDNLLIVNTGYKNDFVIDLEENNLLGTSFSQIYKISDGALRIKTKHTKKFGVLNFDLEYVFDTIYQSISVLNKSYFELENTKGENGLFNFNGDTIVPFGQYKSFTSGKNCFLVEFIEPISNDSVEVIEEDTFAFGVLDTTGQLIKKWHFQAYKNYYGSHPLLTNKNKYIVLERKSDREIFNFNFITGEISSENASNDNDEISNTNIKAPNKAHLIKKELNYELHNWKGKRVTDQVFVKREFDDPFIEFGNFIVSPLLDDSNFEKWGVIDTLGKYLISPIYEEIERIDDKNKDFFVIEDINDKKGLFSVEANKIIIPKGDYYGFNLVNNEFLTAVNRNLLYLFNNKGKLIWTQSSPYQDENTTNNIVKKYNIDFQYNPWYSARIGDFSKEKKDELFGGTSPQYIPDFQTNIVFPVNQLSIIIDTTQIDTIKNRYFGYRMYLANSSSDTLVFSAQDGRLYLKMQALDENGHWQDIDHLTNSWCGNSYGVIWLQPNGLWEFCVPIYDGIIKTKLRMVLMTDENPIYSAKNNYGFYSKLTEDKSEWIYSAPFDGYINPAQLWRKRETSRFSLYRN